VVRAVYRRTSRFERAGDDPPVERISSKQGFSQGFRQVLVRRSASGHWYDSVCQPLTNHLSNVHLLSGNAERVPLLAEERANRLFVVWLLISLEHRLAKLYHRLRLRSGVDRIRYCLVLAGQLPAPSDLRFEA
jgi:hypothetical protein